VSRFKKLEKPSIPKKKAVEPLITITIIIIMEAVNEL
jgi:hypothetical protein